jgi:hypothetical protein
MMLGKLDMAAWIKSLRKQSWQAQYYRLSHEIGRELVIDNTGAFDSVRPRVCIGRKPFLGDDPVYRPCNISDRNSST